MKMMTGYFLTELDYNTIKEIVYQIRDLVGEGNLDDDILDELMEIVNGANPIIVGVEHTTER